MAGITASKKNQNGYFSYERFDVTFSVDTNMFQGSASDLCFVWDKLPFLVTLDEYL